MDGPDEGPARVGSGSGTGRVLIYVSVALAVAAAAVLVLGFDDPRLLRLGIVAALWAALAGSFAAVRVRREATSAAHRTEDMRAIYRLELEREVAARRVYEATVERDLRRDIERGSRDELDALRAELATLRRNLEPVLDGELLVERVALQAESTRMLSLRDHAVPSANPAPNPTSQRALTAPAERAGRRAPRGQPPSVPYQAREDRPNQPPHAAPPGPPRRAPTTYDEDPLFGDPPWPSGSSNGNGVAPHGNGMAGMPPKASGGAHTGQRSVEDLLAAHGSSATPRRRHRRDDG